MISILGGRTRDLVILEDEIRATSDALYVTTDDGSYGEKGLVTDRLKALIDAGERIDYVLAIGPIPMMRAVAETTRPHGIKTVVSLNSVMVDGTGMCGGCRVQRRRQEPVRLRRRPRVRRPPRWTSQNLAQPQRHVPRDGARAARRLPGATREQRRSRTCRVHALRGSRPRPARSKA